MKEWIDINNFEGIYKINKHGEVLSIRTNKILKPRNASGYLTVCLSIDGKQYQKLIHRLVAEAFIPNPNKKETVNHINGNKSDNKVSNLEWATQSENTKHAYDNGLLKSGDRKGKNNPATKLNKSLIENVRHLMKQGIKQKDIVNLLKISQSTVTRISRGYINAEIYE